MFKLYDQKRADLAQSMADRAGDTDQPLVDNGQYVIKENKVKFDKALEKLKVEFKVAVEERQSQISAFTELLDEEVEFKGHAIKLDNMPDDVEPAIIEGLLVTELILDEE